MAGFIFYQGPSQFDKAPIVGIATIESKNRKTGNMIQTWILRQDISPLEAVMNGMDSSICGDCKFRNGICYVAVHQAPLNIWKSYKKHSYKKYTTPYLFANKLVRFGAYGDCVAIPIKVWRNILSVAKGHTCYTHAWQQTIAQPYKEFSMASVDNEAEAIQAREMGWKTFRVKKADEEKLSLETICPASRKDLSKLVTCEKCLLCTGDKRNIVEDIHGLPFKIKNYSRLSLTTV